MQSRKEFEDIIAFEGSDQVIFVYSSEMVNEF